MKRLEVRIEIGNEGVQTGADVAEILRRAASNVEAFNNITSVSGTLVRLKDVNGNSVGEVFITNRRK